MPENAFLKRSFWKTLHRSYCREQIPPPMGSTCSLSLLLYSVYGHFLTAAVFTKASAFNYSLASSFSLSSSYPGLPSSANILRL